MCCRWGAHNCFFSFWSTCFAALSLAEWISFQNSFESNTLYSVLVSHKSLGFSCLCLQLPCHFLEVFLHRTSTLREVWCKFLDVLSLMGTPRKRPTWSWEWRVGRWIVCLWCRSWIGRLANEVITTKRPQLTYQIDRISRFRRYCTVDANQ